MSRVFNQFPRRHHDKGRDDWPPDHHLRQEEELNQLYFFSSVIYN